MTIGPLSAVETGMLAEGKLSGALQPGLNALLHTHSEGNPFFAEELLDGWIEEGALVHAHNQWMAVTPLDHALPPSIVGALRQRFERLSAEGIDHLRVAAIIGRTFNLSLLAAVQEQEVEAIEAGLLLAAPGPRRPGRRPRNLACPPRQNLVMPHFRRQTCPPPPPPWA